MARVAYVHNAPGDDRVAHGYDVVEAEYGRIGNLFKILANAPWLLPPVAGLSVAITAGDADGLDPGLKRLVHLAVSLQNACAYCSTHNSAWAAKSGVDAAKVEALREGSLDGGHFTDAEVAAISWAKAVAANEARRDIDGFKRIEQHFTPSQVVELTVLGAYRTMINLLQEAFWTDLEDAVDSPEEERA